MGSVAELRLSELNAFPQFPDCMFCRDGGITHDDFNGFRWCKCPAGAKRQAKEPQLVDESNAQRAQLGIGAAK